MYDENVRLILTRGGYMKIIGIILIIFGVVDLVGGFAGFDLWDTLGIHLPDIVWRFSAYAEIAIGYALFNFGSSSEEESGGEESTDA